MSIESGALMKTGANEQVLLASQRSEQALIEREYRGLAKDYARDLMRLADSMLAEEITSEMEAEQVAALDQLLVYKLGRTQEFVARFPFVPGLTIIGGLAVFTASLFTSHHLVALLSLVEVFFGVFLTQYFEDCETLGWLNARRKLRLLKGDDFSPHDALHQ